MKLNKCPKIGDKIYVHSSFFIDRGADDFMGGIATIKSIKYSSHLPKEHINYTMIEIEENKNTLYNYRLLMGRQEEFQKEFKNGIAHPEPDYREQFNKSDW